MGGINISTSEGDKRYKEKGKDIGEMGSHCSVEGDQGRLPGEVTLEQRPWRKLPATVEVSAGAEPHRGSAALRCWAREPVTYRNPPT